MTIAGDFQIILKLEHSTLTINFVKQVETELRCSLVICDYGKVQELYDTPATRRY